METKVITCDVSHVQCISVVGERGGLELLGRGGEEGGSMEI